MAAKNANICSANGGKFRDVDEGAWYAGYVCSAKTLNIIQGYSDGTFRPNQIVNFAEGLKMAYVAWGVPTTVTSGEWYERYLQHAKSSGLLFSNAIEVNGGMTRKDVVWIVWKLSILGK